MSSPIARIGNIGRVVLCGRVGGAEGVVAG